MRTIEVIRRGRRGKDAALGVAGVEIQSSDRTLGADDRGAILRCTASLTLTLPETLLDGWTVFVDARGGAVTLSTVGSIDGGSSVVLPDGNTGMIYSSGSAHYTFQFTSDEMTSLIKGYAEAAAIDAERASDDAAAANASAISANASEEEALTAAVDAATAATSAERDAAQALQAAASSSASAAASGEARNAAEAAAIDAATSADSALEYANAAASAEAAAQEVLTAISFPWSYFVANWDSPPVIAGAIAAGTVYSYTLMGVTRYRLVPSPYDAASDEFYGNFDGAALSDYIAARGGGGTLPVTTAQLRAVGSNVPATGGDESFAVTDGDVTYTFAYSPFNIDTSAVNDMSALFATTDFNGNIQYWNTRSVTTMRSMFSNSPFNQPLNAWDVGNVTDMGSMFYNAPFNQPLDAWDVSRVTNMGGMFWQSSFNQPLDAWDVSSVTNMFAMFYNAPFNQPLDAWDVSRVTSMGAMFSSATSFSPENYARTLIGWANRADNGGLDNGLQIGVTFTGSPNGYSTATYADAWPNVPGQRFTDAAAARAYLVAVMGWTVFDGGPV